MTPASPHHPEADSGARDVDSCAIGAEVAARLAADILIAYLPTAGVDRTALPRLITEVRAALQAQIDVTQILFEADGAPSAGQGDRKITPEPAVPVADSIHDEYLVSLEDGKRYRSLRRHLMAKYGMTPQQYRQKWGLPDDYPMVAPSYARERSEVAKRTGLGRAAPPPDKKRDVARPVRLKPVRA